MIEENVMPVKVSKRGNKFRVIEVSSGAIAKTPGGKARDGGGHSTRSKAAAQARAINQGIRKK